MDDSENPERSAPADADSGGGDPGDAGPGGADPAGADSGGADPAALEGREPGEDPEDPYEDVDLETLPDWWREGVELHREYDLRPYRPPRFADGALVYGTVTDLEAEFGVDIRLSGFDTEYGEDWTLLVDGEAVAPLARQRSAEGYTVYDLPANEFERLVRDAVE